MAIGGGRLKSNRAAKKGGIRSVRAGSGAAKVSSRRPFRPNAPRPFADPFASPNVNYSPEATSESDSTSSTYPTASSLSEPALGRQKSRRGGHSGRMLLERSPTPSPHQT